MTTPTETQPDLGKPQPRRRVKWEPAALMVLVLFLGLWLALGPTSRPRFDLRPDATTLDVRIGQSRGVLETAKDPATGVPTFRLLMRGAEPSPIYSSLEIRGMLGQEIHDQAVAARANVVFRVLNITSWASLVWIAIGLGGQLAFMGRMMLQWIVSEKRRQSTITESFWWFSLIGAVALFSYFVWRQDPVGILGQSTGLVIYARNLRLIHKQKRRRVRSIVETAAPAEGLGSAQTGGARP